VAEGVFPLENGHALNEEDVMIRQHILDLMCRGTTTLNPTKFEPGLLKTALEELSLLGKDGLVSLNGNTISVLEKGKLFIRNISATLDARLRRKQKEGNVFSKSI